MKTTFRYFALVFLLLIGIAVAFNITNSIALEAPFISLKSNVGFLILSCAILASLSTLLFSISQDWSISSEKNKLKKKFENTKLNYEIESEKVKQLESKIKTLEEALKAATRK